MIDSEKSIGIFDSGIGGLTVANAVLRELPNENLIYFGDTAHLPYGDKSPETIQFFSKTIGEFLLFKDCKLIIIACNTASSVAYELLQEMAIDKAIVVDVINPVVDYTIKKGFKKVGIIGTQGTINTGAYQKKINEKNPNIDVVSLATPLLAPMIESGFSNGQISKLVIEEYLKNPMFIGIDALILGCTHYPLIKKEVEEFFHNNKIEILATNEIVGQHVKKIIEEKNLNRKGSGGKHKFYVSDYTENFAKATKLFYGESVDLVKLQITKE